MTQPTLEFSVATAAARKSWGMDIAAERRSELLDECRQACVRAALHRDNLTATADDSSRYLKSVGLPTDALGNAAGSLFRGKDWEWTGRWQVSTRTCNNARQTRIWRLVEW